MLQLLQKELERNDWRSPKSSIDAFLYCFGMRVHNG